MELTKQQGDWVLRTASVAIRFTPEAVYIGENGSIELSATPNGAETQPFAKIAQASVAYPDGCGWWCNIKESRLGLWVLFRESRVGYRYYEMNATFTDTDSKEELAFQLRLTLDNEGSVDGFYVSGVALLDDFLHRLLVALLMKIGKACADTIADTAQETVQTISHPIA
jgi:hypothetical protein